MIYPDTYGPGDPFPWAHAARYAAWKRMLALADRVEQLAATMTNPVDQRIMLDYARDLRARYQ